MTRRRRSLAVLASVTLALSTVTVITGGPAQAAPAAPPGPSSAGDAGNPYGNPFNNYLRRPYGVLSSPAEQASLAPVQDNPNEPFDWYRAPRAAIGVYGGPERSIVTPEGDLQTEFGRLDFTTGTDRTPVNQRVKTWQDGYLPIMDEAFTSGGVRHSIEFFAANVPGMAQVPFTQSYGLPAKTLTANVDNMVDFVRVSLTNPGTSPVTHRFSTSLTLGQGIGAVDGNSGPSAPAAPTWNASANSYGGDGKVLLVAGSAPTETNGATADYDVTLAPHQTRTLDFVLPYFVGQQSDVDALSGAGYDAYHARTAAFWHHTLDRVGSDLTIPGGGVETKVLDTYKAGLAFSLLLMNVVGGRYFWNANPTVYDRYWLRDTAFDIDGILDAGFTDVARKVTLEMLTWQAPSGQFISQNGENDGNGEALWAFANYYNRTHDAAFARQVWPAVQRAMNWEWQIRSDYWSTDGGLFPASSMSDNEGVRGHVLTYDLWNIAGEQAAAQIAAAVGDNDTATAWSARHTQYIAILRSKLAPVVDHLGFIPPAIEGVDAPAIRPGWYGNVYGIDWGNLESVWPSGAFAADDPWISESLSAWQQKTFEGVFGYASSGVESTLHSYTPISISVTDVFAGNQQAALSSLYSLLVHTSATDMTSEGMNAAQRWGWSATDQTQPHGEFSGKYLTFLRDMLVNEYDGSLHLANVWSPVWNQPGATLGFDGDTDFGHLSYTAKVDRNGSTVRLDPPTRNLPDSIELSAPDGYRLTSVDVDGHRTGTISGNVVTLPALHHPVLIRLDWTRDGATPPLSFARGVSDYLANYHQMTAPVDAGVTAVSADHQTVEVGQPLNITGTVVNTGGAGYLTDPRAVLYVNGSATQTDNTTFARGIGFTTPAQVISFGHHDEGTVPVTFHPQLCTPGTYTIGVGLGGAAPTHTVTVTVLPASGSVAPTATVALKPSASYLDGGAPVTVTGTLTDTGCLPLSSSSATLAAPDGWTVAPGGGTDLGPVPSGGTANATWTVTPPATPDVPDATAALTASAQFADSAAGTGTATASTSVTSFAAPSSDFATHAATTAHFGQLGDRFAVYADGRDQWTSTDQFGAMYRPGAGSASMTVTTEVTRQDFTGAWAKAGIIARNDLSKAKSPGYVILSATPSNGVVMQWDGNGDGLLDSTVNTGFSSYPVYLKLVRSGATFTGSFSHDGQNWQQVTTADVPSAAATQDVGLSAAAVTGDSSGRLSGAEFNGFAIG